MATIPPAARHRADYILERGTWRVTCRVCGWKAADPDRRILASRFRFHPHTGSPEVASSGDGAARSAAAR